jgi:hypothetical protein
VQVPVQVPKAFSVRDDHEFYPIEHLMARLNPQLRVTQLTTGVHVGGGCTVFWGIIHFEGQKISQKELEIALKEAGFDFQHNGPIHKLEPLLANGSRR